MLLFHVSYFLFLFHVSVWCSVVCASCISFCLMFMYLSVCDFMYQFHVSVLLTTSCFHLRLHLFLYVFVWCFCLIVYRESREVTRLQREVTRWMRVVTMPQEKSRDVWLNMSREEVRDTMPLEKSRDYSCDMSVCGLYVCLYVTLSHEIFMLLMQIYIYNLYVTKLYASLLLYIKYWDMKYFFHQQVSSDHRVFSLPSHFHLITDSFSRTKTLSFSSPSHSPHQNYSHGIFIP